MSHVALLLLFYQQQKKKSIWPRFVHMFQYSMCGCAEREKEIMLPYIIKGILTRKNM